MKKILLGLICLIASINSYATHFSGGELRYEFNGTNYTIKLALYKTCEQGSINLPSQAAITIASAAAAYNSTVTATLVSMDTVTTNCPSVPSSCSMPTSPVPGFIVGTYSVTVSLPSQQNDWVFSSTNSARAMGIVNLVNPGSTGMYLEAKLDNSIAQNSCALVPNSPSYYIGANQATTIPMQIVDPEGDNIQYDIIAPLMAATTPVSFMAPYTAMAPFGPGGTYAINPTTQALSLYSTTTGKFSMAFRVKEYRNSVLIASYVREMTILVLPSSTAASTFPAPASYAPFTVITCPGQSHSITLNFTDPTITDSVYLTVNAPTLPGFTFTTSITQGIPTASTTISWTTPATMNPATLPFFTVKIRARDNSCPRAVADYALMVRTKQCVVDSVWPGDANGDFTVNIYDPLAIAIANGQTGSVRAGATTAWTAQVCANWGVTFLNSVDKKHADCDGNGTVNLTDMGAITANWGLTHPKEGQHKETAGPDLYFDLSGIALHPGSTVNIPIKLGSAANAMTDFYGLATRIMVTSSGTASTPVAVAAPTTWIGTSANTMNFSKSTGTTTVEWAHARIDQQNTSGNGQIGTLTFVVPSNATAGSPVNFKFSNTKMIDKDGNDITAFNEVNVQAIIAFPQSIGNLPSGINRINVVPNPAHNTANLQIALANDATLQLKVVDMVGKTVYANSGVYNAGNHTISLPTPQMAAGMYTIHISGEGWNSTPVVKFVKH